MAGPFQPHQGNDPMAGPPLPYPQQYPSGPSYPGALPPPIPYPRRRTGRIIAGALVALALVAGIVVAIVFSARDGDTGESAVLTPATVQNAIQGYLDALQRGDVETISRNALCGLYEGVRDRRTDDALARLSSDAFRKQFSAAKVTSVDTIVFASANSAQVLFTMQVEPADGSRGDERQAVAQVLTHDNQVLVCSYVQRTAGTF
jgi:hypothetical protein